MLSPRSLSLRNLGRSLVRLLPDPPANNEEPPELTDKDRTFYARTVKVAFEVIAHVKSLAPDVEDDLQNIDTDDLTSMLLGSDDEEANDPQPTPKPKRTRRKKGEMVRGLSAQQIFSYREIAYREGAPRPTREI
jgi:hypothetical protein